METNFPTAFHMPGHRPSNRWGMRRDPGTVSTLVRALIIAQERAMPKSANSGTSALGLRRPVPPTAHYGLPDLASIRTFTVEADRRRRVRDDTSMEPKIVKRDEV